MPSHLYPGTLTKDSLPLRGSGKEKPRQPQISHWLSCFWFPSGPHKTLAYLPPPRQVDRADRCQQEHFIALQWHVMEGRPYQSDLPSCPNSVIWSFIRCFTEAHVWGSLWQIVNNNKRNSLGTAVPGNSLCFVNAYGNGSKYLKFCIWNMYKHGVSEGSDECVDTEKVWFIRICSLFSVKSTRGLKKQPLLGPIVG